MGHADASAGRQLIAFYDRHPINERQITRALSRRGKALDSLVPDDLFDLDQDHYGGTSAVDALARWGRIGPNSTVLDVCAGLGGPARYLASRFGCRVTGVDLNATRCRSALRLTRLVHLDRVVQTVRGDATDLPFRAGSFTTCVSQEAFLHIPDKPAVLRECHRVLALGGVLTFTDWIADPRLGGAEREELNRQFAADRIETRDGYSRLLAEAGFGGVEVDDLSDEWRRILRDRLKMYRDLRAETVAEFGQARYDEYDRLYAFFVGLIEDGKLGGARFRGERSAARSSGLPGDAGHFGGR